MKNRILISIVFGLILTLFSCAKKEKQVEENVFYTCSMDPQVMEKHPGKCPICHMQLTKTVITNDANSQTLKLSKSQVQLANIRTDTVKLRSIGQERYLTGTVALNGNNTLLLSAKVAGRIDKLHVKSIGEDIKPGELIYELYSEELLTAEEDYLLAAQKKNSTPELNDFENMAKNKLLLWGMTEKQIENLRAKNKPELSVPIYSKIGGTVTAISVREGDYITEGTTILSIADVHSLWVEAQVYASESGLIHMQDPVEISLPAYPDNKIKGIISFVNPELVNDSKVNLVRIEIQNPDCLIKPGMMANVSLVSNKKTTLSMPVDAVLQDEKGATVWVQNPDGSYEVRMVTMGLENAAFVEIVSGLKAGEKIVVSGTYLLNSEYVFKKGNDPMKGMKM
jgi:Cu(I)/Ag(I) efflux system membrane fusion protein